MVRALQALGARAVVADSLRDNPNRFEADAYVVVPPIAEREMLKRAVRLLCEHWHVDIILPTTDRDLPVVAELGGELRRAGIVVAASPLRLLSEWADKVVLLEALRSAGLPILPFVNGGAYVKFPLIGKPRRGWGGRGIVTVDTAAEQRVATANSLEGQLYWQPKLAAFSEWSVDFAVSEDGRLSALVARERLRITGGFAVVSRVAALSPVDAVARRAAVWLAQQGVCGIVNLQVLVEPSGPQWVNDVNLRPGTSSGAALGAGVNLVGFMLGQGEPSRATSGVFVRTLRDRFVSLAFERRITGIAFDLDDCLIDQKAWMDDKLSLVVEQWEMFADPQLRARFESAARQLVDEGPWDRLLDIAVQMSGIDKALVPILIKRWRAAHPPSVVVYSDVMPAMQALRASGIRIAVVTDNPAASQKQKLARAPFLSLIDTVVLTDELGAAKPDPRGYLEAAERLGCEPQYMIAIGDSPWRDGLGAVAAGFAGAIIAPRRGGMGNASRERFIRTHPASGESVHWADDLRSVPTMLGLDGM